MKEETFIKRIEKLTVQPGEVVVLRYDDDKITYGEFMHYLMYAKGKFPNNDVVAIPDTLSLQSYNAEQLENVINRISEIITKKQ